jgi:hypothetical protein
MVPVIQIDSSLSKLAFPSKEDNLWVEGTPLARISYEHCVNLGITV